MATKKNQSELIRQYISKNPDEGPKAIQAGLATAGRKVSMSLVNAVKYKRPKGGAKKRAAKVAAAANGAPSKADQIREVARSLGTPVRPRNVIATLREKGIEASSSQVSVVLRAMGLRRRRGRKPATVGAARGVATAKWALEDLVAAKKMAEALGGLDKAREALAALSKLTG